jgi:uncharacterized protein YbaP (TraB family)
MRGTAKAIAAALACGVGIVAAAAAALVIAGVLPGRAVVDDASRRFSEGRLWKISKPGVPDSFVFGTIHIADPRVSAIPAPVGEALARSRVLATELPQAVAGEAELLELEAFDDGRSLEPLIGSGAFARLRGELRGLDLPDRTIQRLKPWAALLKVTQAPPRADATSLDELLYLAARAGRMRVVALESIDEQAAAFDAIPIESQVALLTHALAHRDRLEAAGEATIAAWLRGDLAGLASAADRTGMRFPDMARHYERLTKHIIRDRTALLHHRLFFPLREGRAFVAIGATHLYGNAGLLALLERDGYRVVRVW